MADGDGDRLPDEFEARFGSDPNKADTDGDGLTDAEEAGVGTDPTLPDTDGNGILDPDDDLDGDGVTNRQELTDGTQAFNPDTDGDKLSDGEEKQHGTDPLNPDTDGDGLTDSEEIKLGSDPLRADSNGDGVSDGEATSFERTIDPDGVPASLIATGSGRAVLETEVREAPIAEYENIAGLVGTPIEVVGEETIAKGTLTLEFDSSSVPSGTSLAIVHFDEENYTWDYPADQSVDLANGTATVTTTEFSPFIVVRVDEFNKIWEDEIVVPRAPGGNNVVVAIDSILTLDSSGSMSWNDPYDQRKTAAKSFVDALIPGDKAGVVDFDYYAYVTQPLTENRDDVKDAIDQIDSNGGTDIAEAVRASLDELDRAGAAGRDRVVVLLTDGDGYYEQSLTQRAISSKTAIYTIGLGTEANATLLQSIADSTGGQFYWVQDANELAGAFDRVSTDLGAPDSDGDGIADQTEIKGWRTWNGNRHVTKPDKPDSDDDGLSDGEEAGKFLDAQRGYTGLSNPNKADSDDDGLDDLTEFAEGTKPLNKDSDDDKLTDLEETEFGSDPLNRDTDGDGRTDKREHADGTDPLTHDLTLSEAGLAFLGGVFYGDWEWGAINVGTYSEEQRASHWYLLGQIAAGVGTLGLADVRDLAAQIQAGKWADIPLTIVGLVPTVGDTARTGAKVVSFASKGGKFARGAVALVRMMPRSWRLPIIKSLRHVPNIKLPQDIAVTGRAVAAKYASNGGDNAAKAIQKVRDGKLKIGKSEAQHNELINKIREKCKSDIRVNQRQVRKSGTSLVYVGINRPDLQCIDNAGNWYFAEFDSKTSKRGLDHRDRILLNDTGIPDTQVDLFEVD